MFETDHEVQAIDPEDCGSFAVRLFHARSSIPLTQEELAARAGIQGGQTTIAHYEAGRREPSLENLRRLVWALGEAADYLLATRPKTDAPYLPAGCAPAKRVTRIRTVPPEGAPESVRAQAGDVEIIGRLYVLHTPEGTSEAEHEKGAERLRAALREAYPDKDSSPYSWLVMPQGWTLGAHDIDDA